MGVQCICGHLEDWAVASLIIAQYNGAEQNIAKQRYKTQHKAIRGQQLNHRVYENGLSCFLHITPTFYT